MARQHLGVPDSAIGGQRLQAAAALGQTAARREGHVVDGDCAGAVRQSVDGHDVAVDAGPAFKTKAGRQGLRPGRPAGQKNREDE